jgi:DUF971 family protein
MARSAQYASNQNFGNMHETIWSLFQEPYIYDLKLEDDILFQNYGLLVGPFDLHY